MKPLMELAAHGQSYWMDDLTRAMIRSGELERRVTEEGLRGITSNPKIFSKAISESDDYDEQIQGLVADGRSVLEIYEELVVTDVRDACDILRDLYDASGGADGFVSLEVSPHLAHDTDATVAEARRLHEAVDRPNLLIKVPGTRAGVPAIEQLLFEGINVNVTLLFSIESYEAVARAYVRALERRAEADASIDAMASVASFFLSRIDVLVDELLSHRIRPGLGSESEGSPELLMGRAAIANAKLAYQRFKEIFCSDRWKALEERGARVQRVLWASTSTKNPLYSDVRYVEPLIGPDTVNTLPADTIDAFADHGLVRDTVEEDLDRARRTLDRLERVGIDLERVTDQLLDEGVQKFIAPFDSLMGTLADKRREFLGKQRCQERVAGAVLASELDDLLGALDEQRFGRRLFARDPYLWRSEPEHVEVIRNRLGWLDAPEQFRGRIGEIRAVAEDVRDSGFRDVVLLGMGGSSLCPEVASQVFGSADGWPRLTVLDNTDPAAVRAVATELDPGKTLFVVASKSGTTLETLSFYRYFFDRVEDEGAAEPGRHFMAITDPGTPLAEEARERDFRHCFENPEQIGGRYSALSYFGLVPMALLGLDLGEILGCAHQMRCSCGPLIPSRHNPGVSVGALLGRAGRTGRDKITFVGSDSVAPFTQWVEQLLAESTGKEGRGLLPVVDASLARPNAYADDRVFVYLSLDGEDDPEIWRKLDALEDAGHPVVRIELADRIGLGAEFFRWEVATSAAAVVLGVNPFDEPNVAESKRNTAELLEEWEKHGAFPEGAPVAGHDKAAVHVPQGAPWSDDLATDTSERAIASFVDLAGPGDYVALLPYLRRTDDRQRALQAIRHRIRYRAGVATTLGYGPRYLHSTGQLHKGGPDRGLFVVITADPEEDLPIPGSEYGFGTLQRAQALGDFRSLADRGRRVLRLHLGPDPDAALTRLTERFSRELEAVGG